jgi:hypothetical protein
LFAFRGADLRARGTLYDFLQPPFGGFQLLLAMRLQGLAPLVQGDGVLQINLTLLQPGNNGFQLFERALEAQFFYGLAGRFGGCPI